MTPAEYARLLAFLEIPSVSSESAHAPDMAAAAAAVQAEIALAGGETELRDLGGHPLLTGRVANSAARSDAPRVVIYGHYDVQPIGDPALWTSPAFTPTERDGYLHARGVSDDKGNLFMLLAAVQRMAAASELPVDVEFLIDGEEESGGDSAERWLAASGPAADAAVIFDAPMVGPGRPAICVGLRGLVYRRVRVRTGDRDGHSGLFGGAALNAVHVLAHMLAGLAPVGGRLDPRLGLGAAPASPAERAAWGDLPPGSEALAQAGLRPADPAAAREFYERTTAMASLDVHGLSAGEPGQVKTNIPTDATATLSVRVAPGQDPAATAAGLDALLAELTPPGADLAIEDLNVAAPALVDPGHPVIAAAAAGITAGTGWPVVPLRIGGTIPIVAALGARGVPAVLTGFGLPDDAIHAPDERLRIEYLGVGTRAAMGILRALGEVPRPA